MSNFNFNFDFPHTNLNSQVCLNVPPRFLTSPPRPPCFVKAISPTSFLSIMTVTSKSATSDRKIAEKYAIGTEFRILNVRVVPIYRVCCWEQARYCFENTAGNVALPFKQPRHDATEILLESRSNSTHSYLAYFSSFIAMCLLNRM